MDKSPEARNFDAAILKPENWTDQLKLNEVFSFDQPLEVDVGCGKGRFLTARASTHPDINYLGIDRLITRIRKISKRLTIADIQNVRLLSLEASYAIKYLLPNDCVSVFYILFSDPWPKNRHQSRRLFNPEFLDILYETLTDDGIVHVATDHISYFDKIVELFESDKRFEKIDTFTTTEEERTNFELIFMQQEAPIGRASYRKMNQQ